MDEIFSSQDVRLGIYSHLIKTNNYKSAKSLACTCKLFAGEMQSIIRFLKPRGKMPRAHIRWMAMMAPLDIRPMLLKRTSMQKSVILPPELAILLGGIQDKNKFEIGCQSLGVNLERVFMNDRWFVKACDRAASEELHRAILFAIEVGFWPALYTLEIDTFSITDQVVVRLTSTYFLSDILGKAKKRSDFPEELSVLWKILFKY